MASFGSLQRPQKSDVMTTVEGTCGSRALMGNPLFLVITSGGVGGAMWAVAVRSTWGRVSVPEQ